jgi:hypothetical protein
MVWAITVQEPVGGEASGTKQKTEKWTLSIERLSVGSHKFTYNFTMRLFGVSM